MQRKLTCITLALPPSFLFLHLAYNPLVDVCLAIHVSMYVFAHMREYVVGEGFRGIMAFSRLLLHVSSLRNVMFAHVIEESV